jgi:hypothetical protein
MEGVFPRGPRASVVPDELFIRARQRAGSSVRAQEQSLLERGIPLVAAAIGGQ